jgi:transposase
MTSNKEHIHIVTSVERRRHWSPQDKKIIVEETYQPGNSISLVARKYAITPAQLFKWRRLMENGAYQGVSSQEELVPKSMFRELERQVKELERMLGKKTLENEILKEAVKIAQEKKLISRQSWLKNDSSLLGQ